MQHSFKFSNLMKWSFGLFAFLLVSTSAQAQTVDATINNDLACDINVRVYGIVGTSCPPCFKDFTVTAGGSLTVVVADMPCGVDEFIGATVRTSCSNTSVSVEQSSTTCTSNPTSDSFTLTGTCSITCNTTTVNVDLTSGLYDITVDVTP